MSELSVLAGRPFPQGATADPGGTNFSLRSAGAERVQLCLFDDAGGETRVDVVERTALQWHCYVEGVRPGQRYGYRVDGPYEPAAGLRFNPSKLLPDPYAKAIDGTVDWDVPRCYREGEDTDLMLEQTDSAPRCPSRSSPISAMSGATTCGRARR